MIKWSGGRTQKYMITQILFYAWEDEANRRWEGQVAYFQLTTSCEELLGIDGEPVEFEWSIFPGFTSLQILQRIQNVLQQRNIEPEKIEDRIIFMSMFNEEILEKVKTYAKELDVPRSWRRKEVVWKIEKDPLEGKWDSIGSQMVQRCKETGHPVCTSASALSRGILRTLKGKETIHFNADASNTELLFRIIHSVNQLSFSRSSFELV